MTFTISRQGCSSYPLQHMVVGAREPYVRSRHVGITALNRVDHFKRKLREPRLECKSAECRAPHERGVCVMERLPVIMASQHACSAIVAPVGGRQNVEPWRFEQSLYEAPSAKRLPRITHDSAGCVVTRRNSYTILHVAYQISTPLRRSSEPFPAFDVN